MSACHPDQGCITCGDHAVPMRVVLVDEARVLALCEDDVEVMTDLVGEVAPGDAVLVHAGVAIARLR